MATAPQIALRDNSGYTTNLVFTTNQENIDITGTVDTNTAAVQISVNGAPFVVDPTLINVVLQTFTVPNMVSYPEGLPLDLGVNTIQLRTIDVVGGVSAISTVTVTRVSTVVNAGIVIPTGITVNRNRGTVDILIAAPSTSTATFLGYNVYASTAPGGTTGYYLVSDTPVTTGTTYEENVLVTLNDLAVWTNTLYKTVRIRITEEDNLGNELAVRLDSFHDTSTYMGNLRFQSTFDNHTLTEYLIFTHDRGVGNNADQFNNVDDSDPLYYVVTGLYFDPATNTEIETPYSQEVLGTPLIIDTTIRDLPGRNQTQIVTDYIQAVQRVNSQISMIPGSVTRDVDIDPFASEAERVWFLLDFVHRSGSFLTLMAIDNVSGSGTSDPVATSAYKQALKAALGLTDDTAVQALIDQQFDKLAANVNTPRSAGRSAVGQVVLFTPTLPTQDLVIPAGSFAVAPADSTTGTTEQRFRIGGSFTIPAANASAYYNFSAKRYQVIADVVAENIGSAGNLPAGAIKTLQGVSGVQVTNESATVFGDDQQTNADLAQEAMLGFASVDSGTEGGYSKTAASAVGILKSTIVKSGDALMMRDYDPIRNKHIGGKVDIWVQGVLERQVSEQFAFTFDVATNVQCLIVDVTNLIFRVQDSRVTVNTPIIAILNDPTQNFGVENVTTGQPYDLTGVLILDYQTFQINTAIAQPATNVDDIITADYRFQIVNDFYFTYQPVRRVVSVVGEVAGPLDPEYNLALYKTDDPLLNGESTIAQNYLAISQYNGKPSGNTLQINAELHALIGFEQEPLDSIGINTSTLSVYNSTRTILYNPPNSALPDYDIIVGTPTTPVQIVRTAASTIASGAEVSVDYVHDENFTVTYVINDLLQTLQQLVNKQRHVTADVLVKQAIENSVNIETTVQLESGTTKDKTDPAIRSNVSLLVDKNSSFGLAQSNVVASINSSSGVAYTVLPLALMAYADGSQRLREEVLSTYVATPTLDIGGNQVYILTNPLENPTTDGGGLNIEHKGVFQDDIAMALAGSLAMVGQVSNQAWIIGSGGSVIMGYSDDATLTTAGFLPDQLEAERLRRTANHVLVSLAGVPVDNPGNHAYAVSYIVRGAIGSNDVLASSIEAINLGNCTITYRAAS